MVNKPLVFCEDRINTTDVAFVLRLSYGLAWAIFENITLTYHLS